MANEKEIVLINKSKGKFTINFQGAFPINKVAPRDGKLYLTEKEFEWLKINYNYLLTGEEKRLYHEDELTVEPEVMDDETFFKQTQKKIKLAIAKMDSEEAEKRLRYAQLNEVPEAIVKAIEDRILELDKEV